LKRTLAVIMVLAGGIAAAVAVLQRMGRIFPIYNADAAACGYIGKPDAPKAVFFVTHFVPLVLSRLVFRFFGAVSSLCFLTLLKTSKRNA
jgi:Na+-transporting methylmalonyl-CoA/oxaloacetate decarboxylase beta subunit